jgi:hypothetical protein
VAFSSYCQTHIEKEGPAHRLEINLFVLRLATILPSTVGEHVEVLPLLLLMHLNPLQSLAIHSRFELQNIKKTLILAIRIHLQPPKQLNGSPHTMRQIRPSRNRNDFALELVLAFPSFRLAGLRAVPHFSASSASLSVKVNFWQVEGSSLLAFGLRGTFVETPRACVLEAFGV